MNQSFCVFKKNLLKYKKIMVYCSFFSFRSMNDHIFINIERKTTKEIKLVTF